MRRFLLRWGVRILAVVMLAVTAANFVLIGGALKQGRKARETQCRTFPISVKLYTAAHHYHLISEEDLRTYLAQRPQDCPPRP